jgi:glutathione S-transferase
MSMQLYGHPFSSYTWKALIALYANDTPFEFAPFGEGKGENDEFVKSASPQGLFPVLRDGETVVFEASAIVEYLHLHHPGKQPLLPTDSNEALQVRMIDRVFDNYVMAIVQGSVGEAIATGKLSDATRQKVEEKLEKSYRWIDEWLGGYDNRESVTLIECAAAPSLFYADWVHRIPEQYGRLRDWRAHLLALPAVARCVEDARPYRSYFPLGAPDRD